MSRIRWLSDWVFVLRVCWAAALDLRDLARAQEHGG